jgi:purine-binding chemotaxis protein CheW
MAEIIAQELNEQEEDTQKSKYLTFNIGSETYAIEIRYVTEIIGIQPITEVPEVPEYIKGIINLRGKIIPVMDVRLRFKKPFLEYAERTCVIVIDVEEISIGLIVDSVAEVITIPDSDVVMPPEVSKGSSRFIKGIGKTGKEVKLILDCNTLLTENDIEDIAGINS